MGRIAFLALEPLRRNWREAAGGYNGTWPRLGLLPYKIVRAQVVRLELIRNRLKIAIIRRRRRALSDEAVLATFRSMIEQEGLARRSGDTEAAGVYRRAQAWLIDEERHRCAGRPDRRRVTWRDSGG